MLDFRVDSFLAVCKHLSYTKAAQELNLTQPAITQHINFLESQYQVKLFTRENNKISLTPEGEQLRNAMITVRQDIKKLQEDLVKMKHQKFQLRFGCVAAVAEHSLIPILSDYIKTHPDRDVQLTVATTPELMRDMDNGNIHFAIVDGSFQRENYKHLPWSTVNFVCVCAANHTFTKCVYKFEDLLSEELIIFSPTVTPGSIFLTYLEKNDIHLSDFKRVLEFNSMLLLKQLLLDNCGITFLPKSAVEEELAAGYLKEIPLENFNIVREFHFIWRKDSINEPSFIIIYNLLQGKSFEEAVMTMQLDNT